MPIKDPEKRKAYQAKWFQENKERLSYGNRDKEWKARHRQWLAERYRVNPEYFLSRNRQRIARLGSIAIYEEQKRYRHANRDKIRARKRNYRERNSQEIKEKAARYYRIHSDRWNGYRSRNLDRIYQARRLRRAADPQKYREQDRVYRVNPSRRLSNALRRRICHALRGNVKSASTEKLIGCSIAHLRRYLEAQFRDGMTWANHSHLGWHIDHIIPCAAFDLSTPENQQRCFHFTNLQPLWAVENFRKHAKIAA